MIVGYARDIRKLLRMAWKEYKIHPAVYKAFTDQQLMCFLVADGAIIWTRAAVGIDHMSEVLLSTYQTDIRLDGTMLGIDALGRPGSCFPTGASQHSSSSTDHDTRRLPRWSMQSSTSR